MTRDPLKERLYDRIAAQDEEIARLREQVAEAREAAAQAQANADPLVTDALKYRQVASDLARTMRTIVNNPTSERRDVQSGLLAAIQRFADPNGI